MPRTKPNPKPFDPNLVVDVNLLVASVQKGVGHSIRGDFTLSLEHAQGLGDTFFWRAYVKTGGIVRASSKGLHDTPGGAIDELWGSLKEKR